MRFTPTPVLVCALLFTALSSTANEEPRPVLIGHVIKVTDGDTIKVQLESKANPNQAPINVRLDSIDTPESNQPHGHEATAALAALVADKEVSLDVVTQDRYERLVAVVYVGDLNVNELMVKQGHAWAYRRYLKEKNYCVWENAARELKRGLWSLPPKDWIYPSDWRRLRRHQIDTVEDFSHETIAHCLALMGQ